MNRFSTIGVLCAVMAVAGCASSAKSASSPTTPAGPTTTIRPTPTTKKVKTVKASLDQDAQAVRANVVNVLVAVGEAQKSPNQTSLDTLASVATTAHNNLNDEKDQIAVDSDLGDNNDINLSVAVDDVKSSVGALVTYTGNPNAATLASFSTQYATAVSEWNSAVDAIYAGTSEKPPEIPTS